MVTRHRCQRVLGGAYNNHFERATARRISRPTGISDSLYQRPVRVSCRRDCARPRSRPARKAPQVDVQARPFSIRFQYRKGSPYRFKYHMSRRDFVVSMRGKEGLCWPE